MAAADVRPGKGITLAAGRTLNDDLYLYGVDEVVIEGSLNGSLFAVASRVIITGHVTGDVSVVAPTVELTGTVDGSLRALAGTYVQKGTVQRDVLTASATTSVEGSAHVGRDYFAVAWTADTRGDIGRNAAVVVRRKVLFGAHAGGNVSASGTDVEVTSQARVGSRLKCESVNPARIDPGAQVTGPVIRDLVSGHEDPRKQAARWNGGTLALFLLGWLFSRGAPAWSGRAAAALQARPLASFGLGLASFVVLMPVCLLLLLTSIAGTGLIWIGAVPLVVLGAGFPLALTVASRSLGLSLFLIRRAPVSEGVSSFVGAALVAALALVPWVNVVGLVLILPPGLGALVLGARAPRSATVALPEPVLTPGIGA